MNKITQVLLSLMAIFLIVGCGGSKPSPRPVTAPRSGPDLEPPPTKEVLGQEPKWYRTLKVPDGFIGVKGEGTSSSKGLARTKAKTMLTVDLKQKLEAVIEARTENFQKEIGGDFDSELIQEFTNLEKNIMNGLVGDWEEMKSKTVIESNPKKKGESIYRCYITAKWNKHKADQILLEKLKNKEALRIAFEKTKAHEAMMQDLEKYKEKLGM